MYCQKCGARNDDQAAFCGKCGTALQESVSEASNSAPLDPPAVEYAGFWRRLGASLIDQFIMQIPYILAIPIILVVGIFVPQSWVKTAMIWAFLIAYLVAYLLYGPLMESSRRQATLGKEALGIMVTDKDGKRVSFGRAFGRNLGKVVSAILYYAGFIMIAFTEKKQGLHDIMAKCLVVKK